MTRSFNDIEYSYNPPLSAEYKQLMARAGEIIDAITAATGEEWNDDWDCVTRLDWLEAGVDPEIVEYSIIKYGCSGNGADKKVEVVVEFEDPEFMGYLSTIKTIFVFEAGKWVIDNVDSGKEFLREFIYENS